MPASTAPTPRRAGPGDERAGGVRAGRRLVYHGSWARRRADRSGGTRGRGHECAGWVATQENQQLGIPLEGWRGRFSPRLRKLAASGSPRRHRAHRQGQPGRPARWEGKRTVGWRLTRPERDTAPAGIVRSPCVHPSFLGRRIRARAALSPARRRRPPRGSLWIAGRRAAVAAEASRSPWRAARAPARQARLRRELGRCAARPSPSRNRRGQRLITVDRRTSRSSPPARRHRRAGITITASCRLRRGARFARNEQRPEGRWVAPGARRPPESRLDQRRHLPLSHAPPWAPYPLAVPAGQKRAGDRSMRPRAARPGRARFVVRASAPRLARSPPAPRPSPQGRAHCRSGRQRDSLLRHRGAPEPPREADAAEGRSAVLTPHLTRAPAA